MPTEIRIYFEGHKNLRRGFAVFFSEIRDRGAKNRCNVEFIATGGTPDQDFSIAMRTHPKAWNILLRDSEGSYHPGVPGSDSIFRREVPRGNPNVGEIPKQDLVNGLKAATKIPGREVTIAITLRLAQSC
jgi:hypothetical protein